MIYSNADVRRQDRLLDETAAREILMSGEYGVMSVFSDESGAYGFPVNYVWDGENCIYLHCAPEGKKLRCLDINNKVSFCVIGRTNVISDQFTTEYESIILECTAVRNLEEDERMKAFSLIIEKYSPQDKITGMKYAKGAYHQTEIIRLEIIKWSGKRKKVSP